jgi:hypothetical protein
MTYAMLTHEKPGSIEALAEDGQKAVCAEYLALAEDRRCRGGAQLQPIETATTVRVHGGRTLTTECPDADANEGFGGCSLFEAGDLDEAIELASRIPAARLGGAIEARPSVEL